jgi:hypothetical protein
MKPLALLLALALCAAAAEPVKDPWVKRVVGKCQGGDRPSVGCKTCEHCAYCSPRRWGGTCVVCHAAKSAGKSVR